MLSMGFWLGLKLIKTNHTLWQEITVFEIK